VNEPIVQIGRHDAHLRSQLEHVPAFAAEHANRRRLIVCRSAEAFALDQGILLERQQPHQRGLARAVGTQDGGVLTDIDGNRQVVEDSSAAENNGSF